MPDPAEKPLDFSVKVRPFRKTDQEAARRLYTEGLIGGKIAENDTALDLDDIHNVYMTGHGSHFWVAEASDGTIVGTLGVQNHDEGAGEIRRLRVRQNLRRRGIGTTLMETALRFCQENGYLKIILDTFMEPDQAIKLFKKFHFRHQRSRVVGEKELMYFYLDLYEGEKQK